ncbi:MAG: RNA 2',3'-cyclic phosphodiesterase [Burkholderiales bacterium]|nr:RNA 2',3'-cyclic phosphodiesterase [Burkholderiales bacterium]
MNAPAAAAPPDAAGSNARLFLALWPDPATVEAILAWRSQWLWPPGCAAVDPGRLHLTLHFIGSVPAARVAEVAQGLAAPCPRFEIEFGSAQVWPRGIALLSPLAVPAELDALHTALGHRLAALGLALEDRPYRPHVTLARKAAAARPPAADAALGWAVRGYSLVRSAGGYTRIADYG